MYTAKKVRFYDDLLKDKIVVLTLMYADCSGVCPTITSHLMTRTKQATSAWVRYGNKPLAGGELARAAPNRSESPRKYPS